MSESEEEKHRYREAAEIIGGLLEAQTIFIDDIALVRPDGSINVKPLGYVYGFADCALQIAKLDIASHYGQGVLMMLITKFDNPNGDRLFEYLQAPTQTAALMEGVYIGGIDYNDWVISKGQKMPLRWRECFIAE
jgi:hypothetical protein